MDRYRPEGGDLLLSMPTNKMRGELVWITAKYLILIPLL